MDKPRPGFHPIPPEILGALNAGAHLPPVGASRGVWRIGKGGDGDCRVARVDSPSWDDRASSSQGKTGL